MFSFYFLFPSKFWPNGNFQRSGGKTRRPCVLQTAAKCSTWLIRQECVFLQYLFCPLLIFRFAPQQDNVQSMSFALRWSSAWSFFSTSSSSSTTQGGHFSRLWFSFQMFAQLSPTFRPLFKTLGNAVSNAFIWFPSRKTPGNCHSCLSSVGEFGEIVNLPCRGCN